LAARTAATVNVPDVRQDPRYLACFPHTRSELVVPIITEGQVVGEIDIDSDTPAAFTKEDEDLVNGVAGLLARYWGSGG
jgi:GAF domain-containing protein